MHDRARSSPNPSVPVSKKPRSRAGHVGQIRLSDWSKFEILRSDWLLAKPTPFTTLISSKLCLFFILATWIVAIAVNSPQLFVKKLVEYPE